jgi:hypothetical protein
MTEEVIEQNPTENVLQNEPPPEIVSEIAPETPPENIEAPETPEPETRAPEKEDGRKNPWYLKRISETSERARLAEEEAANLKAMLDRLQAPKETPTVTQPANTPDFQTAVQREAAKLRLAEDSTAIRDAGYREFGQEFGQNLAILNAAGAVSDDIVLDLIAVDKPNAHKILATLAQDPDRAAALANMDSRRRTAELTRISMAANAPTTPAPKTPAAPTKQVSRAPAPPPPVEPSATKTVPWYSDEASDADFDKGFYDPNRMKKRQRL